MVTIDLEQAFLGSVLRAPSGLASIPDVSGCLLSPPAVASFGAAMTLFRMGKPVNLQSVALAAGIDKYAGWLSEAEDIGVGANLGHWADELVTRAARARVKRELTRLVSDGDSAPLGDTLEALRALYSSELLPGDESGGIAEAMQEFEAQSRAYMEAGSLGISTGFTKYDDDLITYEPGHLWAIGGFTSVGKTATALEFVGRIGANRGIAIFSLEMTKPQIISRMLSRLTGYSSRLILSGKINDSRLHSAKVALQAQPIHIFRKARSWAGIANCCRVLKLRGELDVAVWDYMQNIQAEGKTTHDKMEAISRGAQALVQDLGITGLMLSQISLQQNREDSGSPEFKGGGGLAECADVAIHLSRPKGRETELLVDMRKNRHGPKTPMLLEYQDHYTRLEEVG